MKTIETLINFLNTNAAGIAIIVSLIAGVIKFIQFVNIKKRESKQKDFENYHKLVERLVVDRTSEDGRPFIDIQIATIYELENFPRYKSVSIFILNRMKDRLVGKPDQKDVISQIEKTLKKIA